MIPIQQITGRLGNQMFQYAFLYNYSIEHDIDRYVQDPKFFAENNDEIVAIFQEGVLAKPIDMVAIHVRRGDYVSTHNHFYVDLFENGYYQRAMDEFQGKEFLVFSDDIEWCKKQDIFKDCEFYHGTEIEDMNMMASCVGHIVANSSFSWWGAYISPYTEKVVAPSVKNWYKDGFERTICPTTWVRL